MKTTSILVLCGLIFAVAALPEITIVHADPQTVRINSDGTVEGTEKIHRDENLYMFTNNIYGFLVVEKDDITVDGAGYILQGNGIKTGINLSNRTNVTITNLEVKNFTSGIHFSGTAYCNVSGNNILENKNGIHVWGNSNYNTISQNIITFNRDGIMVIMQSFLNNNITENVITNNYEYGVHFLFSYNNTISGNEIADNECGVILEHCSNNVFRNNRLNNNNESFYLVYHDLSDGFNDVDTSNTVDKKPIYYGVNQQNRIVPSDAGYACLINCSNIVAQNLNLVNSPHGILVASTTDSLIKNCTIENKGNGIELKSSINLTITENIVTGISVSSSKNITITENNIKNSRIGVSLSGGRYVLISRNNITSNIEDGIKFLYSNSNNISYNYIAGNQYTGINLIGIGDYDCDNNSIIGNTLLENNGVAVYLSGAENNTFYHNSFIGNGVSDGLQVSNPWYWGSESNVWDNGLEGNYWSNYNEIDTNNDGIGDTPFVINSANIDNHPLMAPADTGVIPEFSSWIVLPLFFVTTVVAVTVKIKFSKGSK
ncbi:MAG: NosD domain-containing protein [archaeon]